MRQLCRQAKHICCRRLHLKVSARAELLCSRTGMKKVFFANSGAEANECLIKAARKYGSDRYGDVRPNIITLVNSFHGRTVTTLSATGQEHYHQHFGPFTPGFIHVAAGDTEGMRASMENGDVCAVLLEMVQGEGGVIPLDKAFVQEVYQLCHTHDVLFMVDEVQTGNGRTGSLYAYMQYGVTPDAFSTAKALAGGLPFGAAVLSEKLEHTLGFGDHGSTFGGNPICAAGAYSILSRIDDALLTEVKNKEAYIRGALSGAKGVKSITGLGLMLGIECEKPASEVVAACLNKGVVALTAKNKLRLLPALNIPMELLIKGIDIIKEAIAE